MEKSTQAESKQYLSFFIGEEEYALGILRVREIIEYDVLTAVPGTPPWIRGVINLRGTVVPVMDLGIKFGLQPIEPGRRSCIVMVEVALGGRSTVMGILSDAVSQVIDVQADQIEEPPSFGTNIHAAYLHGLIKGAKKFVLLLDIDRVLTHDEVALAKAAIEPPPERADSQQVEAAGV